MPSDEVCALKPLVIGFFQDTIFRETSVRLFRYGQYSSPTKYRYTLQFLRPPFSANAFEEFFAPIEAQDDYPTKAFADYGSHGMLKIGGFGGCQLCSCQAACSSEDQRPQESPAGFVHCLRRFFCRFQTTGNLPVWI